MAEKELTGNILVVDDQIENLRLLAAMLKAKNYKVRKATDGASAIEAIQIEPPDLILLDIKMPGMNGYEVCQSLKSDAQTKDIPVIFISVNSEVLDKVKAFEVGGIDYITKPFYNEEVLARINCQLTIKRKQKQLEQEQEKLKQEIKKRKEAEAFLLKSKALISSLLTNCLDGISILEAVRNPNTKEIEDFRCILINPIMAEVLNQEPEELTGKLVLKQFVNKFDYNLFDDFVKIVETGVSLEKTLRYQHKQEQKWYFFVAVKLEDGLEITIRDINK